MSPLFIYICFLFYVLTIHSGSDPKKNANFISNWKFSTFLLFNRDSWNFCQWIHSWVHPFSKNYSFLAFIVESYYYFFYCKRCNFYCGGFLCYWLVGIKIMKSILCYWTQWSEIFLCWVLLAPSSVVFFNFFVLDPSLMKLGEVIVLMSTTTSPSFIKDWSKTKKLKKTTLDGAKSTQLIKISDHWVQ